MQDKFVPGAPRPKKRYPSGRGSAVGSTQQVKKNRNKPYLPGVSKLEQAHLDIEKWSAAHSGPKGGVGRKEEVSSHTAVTRALAKRKTPAKPTSHPAVSWKSPMLRRGSKGDLVQAAQRRLGIKADGIYGRQTNQAVRNFQRSHGLAADGIIGPKTRAAMAKYSSKTGR